CSLRSEEDRRIYLEHVTKDHGESYALDLVRMLGISFQMERDAREASSEVFDQAYKQVTEAVAQNLTRDEEAVNSDSRQAIEDVALKGKMNLHDLLAFKEQLQEDIEHLEK